MTSAEQRIRKTEAHQAILGVIKAAGILSVALIAPNALAMFNLGGAHKRDTYRRAFHRLQRKGSIVVKEKNGMRFAQLTPQGDQQLQSMLQKELTAPKHWDGKWRIVVFDIKEHKKKERDMLRYHLQNAGFTKLQNSIWVYPYDTEELITLLKTRFQFGKHVLYIIAQHIENDRWLRERYEL